ncbi:MAG: hypothetical protein KDA80_20695 [Planctomycetaceae bacterium]|nr:hypothetical protein [Planctomycetaceae bacterium]
MDNRISSDRQEKGRSGENRSREKSVDPSDLDLANFEFKGLLASPPESSATLPPQTDELQDGLQKNDSPFDVGHDQQSGATDGSADSIDSKTDAQNFSIHPGDAILHQLTGVTLSDEPSSTGQIADIVQEVTDRILVTDPKLSSTPSEVRIQLRDSVLPNTEVRLSHVDGVLRVQLCCQPGDVGDWLTSQELIMNNQLAEKLPQYEVSVTVVTESSGEGNPDGRSRQRRNLNEDRDVDNKD